MGRTEDRLVRSGIEVTDILTVARKMAISILETPEIMNAEEAPKIALIPVANLGNFNINENIFTKRIRVELNKNASKKMSFIARDFIKKNQITEYIMKERLIKREEKSNDEVGVTNITSSKDLDLVGVDFLLTGELNGLAKKNIRGQADYVMMSFQLIDAETGVIVWEDVYEIKSVAKN
ncbi:MAG: penicillin-binding protein activator LpoB [Candidatus Zapsychrus exili]|nr:penicillin-binding protein activator LpoB [Candidatus Zapsychrus exili]